MQKLFLQSTELGQWHALISEAECKSNQMLDDTIKGYLSQLLIKFTDDANLAQSVLALDYIEASQSVGEQQGFRMRDLGDKCLLFAGLFPGRAEKKMVCISYFVDLGQSAYCSLDDDFYDHLCQKFVQVMDVMQAMRQKEAQDEILSILQAATLWQKTGSCEAYARLKRGVRGQPVRLDASGNHSFH